GSAILRELRLRLGAQLHRLLQPRARAIVREAVGGSRPGEAQAPGLGHRQETAGGWRAADRLPLPRGDLLAAAAQGRDDHGQQPIQWLAHGRLVARPLTAPIRSRRRPGPIRPSLRLPWFSGISWLVGLAGSPKIASGFAHNGARKSP